MVALTGCSSSLSQDIPSSSPPVNTTEHSPFPTESKIPEQPQKADDAIPTINIQIEDKNFTATMYDNDAVRTIIGEMPFTLEMDDYASQEKVASLPFALLSDSTETPARINSGDIYLWSGNNLVLFYTSFSNSYNYVPIGYVEDATGLRDALGNGSVTITFSVH